MAKRRAHRREEVGHGRFDEAVSWNSLRAGSDGAGSEAKAAQEAHRPNQAPRLVALYGTRARRALARHHGSVPADINDHYSKSVRDVWATEPENLRH